MPAALFLDAAVAFLKRYRSVVQIMGLIALAGLLWAIWLHFHDKAVVAKHEEQVAQAVATASAAASGAATDAVTATQTEVEKTNAKAQTAANRSDDPLRAGLGELRKASHPHSAGSR